MARPREFDLNQVLEKAMDVFWQQGYHATSIRDLTEAMGLLRGSVYAAFGDKHQLFLAALERYMEKGLSERQAILDRPGSIKANIRDAVFRIANKATSGRGCLVANSALELLPHDSETTARINRHFQRMEAQFVAAIAQAQANNEIPRRHDAASLARALVCQIQGLRVLEKIATTQLQIQETVEIMLEILD
jgi:TetR/AcrR family transcriptional regulator, transcriptional repressor for nem operon